MTRPLTPHRFIPKSGHRWRWCVICDLTDTADVHRTTDDDTEET